ncbi:MAG: SUMF1/EgtB/PvdO family nonheme iron enzyme [Polyangiaceae bacterium]
MRILPALVPTTLIVLGLASCDERLTMGDLNGAVGAANAPGASLGGSGGMRSSVVIAGSVGTGGSDAMSDDDPSDADTTAGASPSSAAGSDDSGAGSGGRVAGSAGGGGLSVGSLGGSGGTSAGTGGMSRGGAGASGAGTSGADAGAGGATAGGAGTGGSGGASGGTGGGPFIGCGNGILEGSEVCDDGNQAAADGCSPTCTVEAGYACAGTPSWCSSHPSCVGMPKTCSATGHADCCAAGAVPGGTFNRRNDPKYPATVSNFVLENFEITVGRFRKFVAAYSPDMITAGAGKNPHNPSDTGWDPSWNSKMPQTTDALVTSLKKNVPYASWLDSAGNDAVEHRPINYLSWLEAEAFCIWDGGRLPTQAEWNYAATAGAEQRTYPWGNNAPLANTDLAIFNCLYNAATNNPNGGGYCTVDGIAPVGFALAGNGKWGQSDLSGNLTEFVQDYAMSPKILLPVPCVDCANLTSVTSGQKQLFGADYTWPNALLYSENETFPLQGSTLSSFYTGARCVRDTP